MRDKIGSSWGDVRYDAGGFQPVSEVGKKEGRWKAWVVAVLGRFETASKRRNITKHRQKAAAKLRAVGERKGETRKEERRR